MVRSRLNMIDKIAYEIYQIRQEKRVHKSQDWDWWHAELYLEVECGDTVREFIEHVI